MFATGYGFQLHPHPPPVFPHLRRTNLPGKILRSIQFFNALLDKLISESLILLF
jgi:hypothetical protein